MRPDRRLAVLALLAVGAAFATAPEGFDDLLAAVPPARRAVLEARARAWSSWSTQARDAFAERAAAWNRLTPAERGERRAEWAAWTRLTPAEQARVREAAAVEATLDPGTGRTLHEQFESLDFSTRHGWRLGPELGVDYPRLQPLLAQVPADEADALIATLRRMAPFEREQLAVLVQRTPPQARDALRRELVSTSDANRSGWLALRLER